MGKIFSFVTYYRHLSMNVLKMWEGDALLIQGMNAKSDYVSVSYRGTLRDGSEDEMTRLSAAATFKGKLMIQQKCTRYLLI